MERSRAISTWCVSVADVERARRESAGPSKGRSGGPLRGPLPSTDASIIVLLCSFVSFWTRRPLRQRTQYTEETPKRGRGCVGGQGLFDFNSDGRSRMLTSSAPREQLPSAREREGEVVRIRIQTIRTISPRGYWYHQTWAISTHPFNHPPNTNRPSLYNLVFLG